MMSEFLTTAIENLRNNATALNQNFWFRENYHSHYDDDDAENYFYNPVTHEFSKTEWTTRGYCGAYSSHDSNTPTVQMLIDAGVIDKETFIRDLIAKYGLHNAGYATIMTGYRGGMVFNKNFGLPIKLTGRKYKGDATLIAYHKGYISRYGRVESSYISFVTADGKYCEASPKYEFNEELYKELMTEKLINSDVAKAINFVLPWNEASMWGVFPLVKIENLHELKTNFDNAKELVKLESQREFLTKKYGDLLAWSKSKFENETAEFHISMAKKCLIKYYDVKNEQFIESLAK